MPTIKHEVHGIIDVEIINQETHRGEDIYQVQATDDGLTLRDESGEAPWMFEGDVAFEPSHPVVQDEIA